LPFQHCLRIDVPKTWATPKPQKIVLCFMDDGEYNRAARAIRRAQFAHFDKLRLESQPTGAIPTEELMAACSDSTRSTTATKNFTQDLKVKEADSPESLKCVSLDREILVVESKSKSFGIMRSKRTTIQTLGLPISFISPVAIALPTQIADVTFTFANSRDRDVFAYKLFLNSKGDPDAGNFSGSGTVTSSASLLSSQKSRAGRSESVFISRCFHAPEYFEIFFST